MRSPLSRYDGGNADRAPLILSTHMITKFIPSLALFVSAAISSVSAATFTFSGGDGSPLRITSDAPITFTLNQAYSEHYISIALEDVFTSDHATEFFGAASTTFTLTTAGGYVAVPFEFQVAHPNGSTGHRDINLSFNMTSAGSLLNGTQVTLSAGTIISGSNYAGTLPDSATFDVWVRHNNSGVVLPISNEVPAVNAASVPEPSSFAMLAGLGALAWVGTRRRRA